jgi:hypothetical protein
MIADKSAGASHSGLQSTVDINSARAEALLRAETPVKSMYEEAFKECLLDLGVRSYYEPFHLWVGPYHGRDLTYTPDFLTELSLNGRQVLLEPHPLRLSKHYRIHNDISKFEKFKSMYGKRFYFILASDICDETIHHRSRTPISKFADEYWEVPHIWQDDTGWLCKQQVKETVHSRLEMLLRKAR